MPGVSSSTGLIAARVRPIYKPKPKKIELCGTSRPALFTLRPFAGLFNPFPYGCSVLCNHPADCEAKEFVKRAKESWATEGKALLLPTEMEMIRATLLAGGVVDSSTPQEVQGQDATATTTVPEELFRKYTETDSRPLTPTPTLASGPLTAHRSVPDEAPTTCNPRERTTLILDLRTASQEQEAETLSWHALTLEPPPSPKRYSDVSKPIQHQQIHQNRSAAPPPPSPVQQITSGTFSDQGSSRNEDQEEDSDAESSEFPMKRRGKRLKKRKCRRGSAYGQQNEVRDPLEPPETQVSQVDDESRRNSAQHQVGTAELKLETERPMTPVQEYQPKSFLTPEILKHLGRELDREAIEEEFSLRRKIALEEALRVKEETQPNFKTTRVPSAAPVSQNAPRVYSRQSARFELLDSAGLAAIKPLDYLGKFVFLTPGRKLIFGRTFNKFYEDTMDGFRYIQPNELMEALQEVMGKPLNEQQRIKFQDLLGDIREPLNFRTWCGVCAICERLLTPLPPREIDPPSWIERADFEALERRLKNVDADPKLIKLLRNIRDQ